MVLLPIQLKDCSCLLELAEITIAVAAHTVTISTKDPLEFEFKGLPSSDVSKFALKILQ